MLTKRSSGDWTRNADDKQCAIACIRVDEAGLAEFYELFHPERYSYKKNSPAVNSNTR